MNRSLGTVLLQLAGGGLAGLLAACGAGSENSPDTRDSMPPPRAPASAADRDRACPLTLPGTTSTVEDTVDGVAVQFATPKAGDQAELRRRVERLADMQNQGAAPTEDHAAAPPQGPGETPNPAGAQNRPLETTASVEPGEDGGGVRLILRPRDPARLDATRDLLRKQADDLVSRVCDEAARKSLR
jgi:hypothetical protein